MTKSNHEDLHNQTTLFDFVLSPSSDTGPCKLRTKSHVPLCIKKADNLLAFIMNATKKKMYLKPSSHISVIKVSPGYTCRRNRPNIFLTICGSPLQIHLIIALTAKPSVHSPCNIGRENLQQMIKISVNTTFAMHPKSAMKRRRCYILLLYRKHNM